MLKNGFYNVVGAVIRTGLTLLTIPLLIRLIGVEEYGLWVLVSTAIGIVGLAEAGLSVSTTVFLSRDLASDNTDGVSQTLTVTFSAMLLLATMAGIALWIGAALLVDTFFSKLEPAQHIVAVQALQLGGLVVWARLLQQVLVGIEQAYQRYGVLNLINTLQVGLSTLGMLVVAWLGGRAVEMMTWQAAISVGILIVRSWVGWLSISRVKLRLIWDNTKALTIVRYSLMTWLTTLGSALFGQCDRLIVGAILGTKVLGVYAAITSITGQINIFSALPIQPLLPAITKLTSAKECNKKHINEVVRRAVTVNVGTALGIGAILLLLSPFILSEFLSISEDAQYLTAFQIAIFIYSFYSLNVAAYYFLYGIGKVHLNTFVVLLSGVISSIMILVFAKLSGLLGAIVGNSGYLLTLTLNLFMIHEMNDSIQRWINFIILPSTLFFVFFLTAFFKPYELLLNITIMLVISIPFGVWFSRNVRQAIRKV